MNDINYNNHNRQENDLVVVDSVLCYVINKRGRINDDELKLVVENHFSVDEIGKSYDLLIQYSNIVDDDGDDCSSKIDSILNILTICQQNRRILPKFAAVDLNNLPSALINRGDSSEIILATSVDGKKNNNNNEDDDDRVLLTRILQELKNLKEMVEKYGENRLNLRTNDISSNGTTNNYKTNINNNSENLRTPSPLTADDPGGTVNVTVLSSPAPSSDDPSPTESFTTDGRRCPKGSTGRKRGNSRGTSSIEDAVAKIKAIRSDPVPSAPKSEPDTGSEHECDQEKDLSSEILDCTTTQRQLSPLNILNRAKQNFSISPLCSTSSMVPPTFPITCPSNIFGLGLPSMDIGKFFSPSYMDVLAPFVTPSTAVVNVDPCSMMTTKRDSPITKSPRTVHQQQRPSSSCSLKTNSSSFSPAVQKLSKQNINNNNSHKAVPSTSSSSCNGNGIGLSSVKLEPSVSDNEKSGANCSSVRVVGDSNDSTYKPYVCQHANCNKRFANKFLLKKHEFIHTGERPHQCTYCCKRFNRKDNLLRHKKTHEANYSLVRRRSRHLFGVGGAKDITNTNSERPASLSLPSSITNDSASILVSPRMASSSSESASPSDAGPEAPGSATPQDPLKFVREMNNIVNADGGSFASFVDKQQQQVQLAAAAAYNAYKATTAGLAAAIWSHAGGVSSSDN